MPHIHTSIYILRRARNIYNKTQLLLNHVTDLLANTCLMLSSSASMTLCFSWVNFFFMMWKRCLRMLLNVGKCNKSSIWVAWLYARIAEILIVYGALLNPPNLTLRMIGLMSFSLEYRNHQIHMYIIQSYHTIPYQPVVHHRTMDREHRFQTRSRLGPARSARIRPKNQVCCVVASIWSWGASSS